MCACVYAHTTCTCVSHCSVCYLPGCSRRTQLHNILFADLYTWAGVHAGACLSVCLSACLCLGCILLSYIHVCIDIMGLFPCSPSPTCPCGACPFSLLWAAHDSAQGHIALLLLQGIRQEHSAPLPCRESDIVVWLGTRCCLHRSLSLSVRLSLAAPHLCLSFSTGSSVDAGASTLGMCFKYEY